MSYYKIKNLKIDKKNNKISCDIADSSIRSWDNKFVFDHCDDIYDNLKTIGDKICTLYYNIIEGNIHIDSGKYKDLVCTFITFNDFIKEYRDIRCKEDIKENELYNLYLKYENDFKDYLKKDCVLKQKGFNNRFIVRVNKNSISINYGIDRAKKFNSKQVKQNKWYRENFDIVYI